MSSKSASIIQITQIITDHSQLLLRAYSSIFFQSSPWIGAIFLIATFTYPNIGFSGLIAAILSLLFAKTFNFLHVDNGLHIYNSLLVGLSLGAVYQLDQYLSLLLFMGAALSVITSSVCSHIFWRLDRLPVLSLPFVLVALCTALASQGFATLQRYLEPQAIIFSYWPKFIDSFLIALGSAFFSPHQTAGLLIFIGLIITSRYLALMAVTGFTVGQSLFNYLSGSHYPDLTSWIGFNFILSSIAIGAVFTVPGKSSFLLAILAAALSALITAACESAMLVYGLPVMALPFLLSTLTLLMALRQRLENRHPKLIIDTPALPEVSLERQRLADCRGIGDDSTAIGAPFIGRWQVYQGMNGAHTHQGPWAQALDFYQTENDRSFRGNGDLLQDYFCFGLPICSPVYGQVVDLENAIPDNQPGHVETHKNWGNYLLIRMTNGQHLLMAHLQQFSIKVIQGEWLLPGQILANCGNSGRSPQPHLHMHVQYSAVLGSHTAPFHLTGVLEDTFHPTNITTDAGQHYRLRHIPREDESVISATTSQELQRALQLPIGKQLRFRISESTNKQKQVRIYQREFTVTLTLLGEFRLFSDSGASVAFSQQHQLLACYDRQGPKDYALDALLLSLGLTPLIESTESTTLSWFDSPSAELLPLSTAQRWLLNTLRPLGCGLHSDYSRKRSSINHSQWQQQGRHQLQLLPYLRWSFHSEIAFDAHLGLKTFSLIDDNHQGLAINAELIGLGQVSDNGIPEWQDNALLHNN